jgi:O-antigen/teichoic acid export membrane protein
VKTGQLIRSTFYMLGGSGGVLILSLAITVLLAKLLSPRDLGILMAAEAFVELFTFFFNIGFKNSILKFAAADKDGFNAGLNKAIPSALIIKLIVLIPISFCIYFVAQLSQADGELRQVIYYYIGIYVLESFASVFGIARKALGQFKLVAFLNTFDKVLRLSVIYVVLNYYGGMLLLVQCFLLEKVLRLIISSATTLRLLKPKLALDQVAPMIKDSIGYGLLDSLETIQNKIDRTMLNSMIGPIAVASYSIPSKLNRAVKMIPQAITQVFLPSMHDKAVSDIEQFKWTSLQLSRFCSMAGVLVAMLVYYWSVPILDLFFGDKYAEAILIAPLFAFVNLFWFLEKAPELVILTNARHRDRMIVLVLSIVTNIACNWIFIAKFGVVGAVYGGIAAYGLKILSYWVFTWRYLDLSRIFLITAPVLLLPFTNIWVFAAAYISCLFATKSLNLSDLNRMLKALKNK